jgi:hypothetical protein
MVNLLLDGLGFLGWSHDAQTCLAKMDNIDLPTLAFGQILGGQHAGFLV